MQHRSILRPLRPKTFCLLAATLLALSLWLPASARAETPVVVELFTSQGCYSCPPADALLGELAREDGIVALGYHVNYWDRLGWADPFATVWGTERQYAYAAASDEQRVYTPQIVVDGNRSAVGSREQRVRRLIASAKRGQKPASPRLRWLASGRLGIDLPTAPAAAGAAIWLIRFDERRVSDILRGENGGKRLAYHHVVRERLPLGRFDGEARMLEAPIPAAAGPGGSEWGVAVLVQDELVQNESGRKPGRIWGAAILRAQ